MFDILTYFYLFAFFSLMGWWLEFLYRSLINRRLVNPGFLKGPYLPIYGIAAVILTIAAASIREGMVFSPAAPFIHFLFLQVQPLGISYLEGMELLTKGLLYLLIVTGIELAAGLFFSERLKKPLWDYSNERFCFNNHICLKFTVIWVLAAFALEYILLPLSLFIYREWESSLMSAVTFQVCAVMLLDCAYQLSLMLKTPGHLKLFRSVHWKSSNPQEMFPNTLHSHSQPQDPEDALTAEFNDILKPLLDTEDVKYLAAFRHHGHNSRLDHSLEVAWHSYVTAKILSLDYVAATRGGLLHDLFFYDWMTDGPRLHGYRHPTTSLKNALKIAHLNKKERDIIKKHMWPLTLSPPRYLESWIVCLADTYCGIKDCLVFLRKWEFLRDK